MFGKGNPGTLFRWPWEPEGSEKGLEIRLLDGKQMRELERATVTEKNVVIDGVLHPTRVIDWDKRERMRLDISIVSWLGLVDDQGRDVECTPENKVTWMRESIDLAAFYARCLEDLTAAVKARTEIERKN